MFIKYKFSKVLFMLPTLLMCTGSIARQWDLHLSVQQAISNSPELQKSMAEIGSRQADVGLSSLWPDPEIGFRIDNKLGQDDGAGGYDLTDITISQSIPMSRIKYQESAAEANLKAAHFSRQYKMLQVQNRVAKVFHQLQLASAELALAKKQLDFSYKLNIKTRKSGQGIVRYLTPLEKMRLNIIQEEARQAESSAEGKYYEALNEYAKLLVIDLGSVSSVAELLPITTIPNIESLVASQDTHVQLASQQQQVLAASHEVDVARSSQSIDPSVGLSWSRDSFEYGRDDVYAIMFNLQIPLSDRKNTAASKATYKASQQRIDLQLMKRELKINLHRSFTHLNHVVEQAADYKNKVLKPAKRMLDLTDKGFTSGELNILSLVDSNNTYFQARLNYLELLYQARVELAEVKLFSGQLIIDADNQKINSNAVGE